MDRLRALCHSRGGLGGDPPFPESQRFPRPAAERNRALDQRGGELDATARPRLTADATGAADAFDPIAADDDGRPAMRPVGSVVFSAARRCGPIPGSFQIL